MSFLPVDKIAAVDLDMMSCEVSSIWKQNLEIKISFLQDGDGTVCKMTSRTLKPYNGRYSEIDLLNNAQIMTKFMKYKISQK